MTMTISGDGTIGGLVAGGLPNATIQQADLAANIAGTGPAFSAYLGGSTQSFTSGVATKAVLDSEEFDTGGCFNSTGSTATLNGLSVPAYSFCPNVAGYYNFNLLLRIGCGAGFPSGVNISLYKNGSEYSRVYEQGFLSNAGAYGPIGGSIQVYLNGTGDYVSLYGNNSGTSPTFKNDGYQFTSRMNGFLTRAA